MEPEKTRGMGMSTMVVFKCLKNCPDKKELNVFVVDPELTTRISGQKAKGDRL